MQEPIGYDPYDPWMSAFGVKAKALFYKGHKTGKLLSIAIALADWLLPNLLRRLSFCQPRAYPISTALWILSRDQITHPDEAYTALMNQTSRLETQYGVSWGLGFPWMSKNGLYSEQLPFITHTPYGMEALLALSRYPETADRARTAFQKTWIFLESLKVMHEGVDTLALSYAPIDEPRIVVNANAYASYAYSLHYAHDHYTGMAKDKAIKLCRWIIKQQHGDGSWHYYADRLPGNFIDCFHTCFVLKNLIKAGALIPEIRQLSAAAVTRGYEFLNTSFFDKKSGLMKRFIERDIKDPYSWDLYDQAEYLGLLIQMGERDRALAFREHVRSVFFRRGHWYCRIDMTGRSWGRDFYRWGIMPFLYYSAKIDGFSKNGT